MSRRAKKACAVAPSGEVAPRDARFFGTRGGMSPAEGGAGSRNRVEWRAGRFKAWAERRRGGFSAPRLRFIGAFAIIRGVGGM